MVTFNNSIPLSKPIPKDNDDQNDNHETPTYLHYDDNNHHQNHHRPYEANGKVMLTAIISLSVVVLLVLALHIFARCILRRNSGHRRRPETHHRLSFSLTSPLPPPDNKTGLDAAAIAALPISAFKPTSSGDEDCSVCLGVLAEGELVRLLPSCCHVFHVECVDTWLAAQPTCPICRAEVESPPPLPPPPPPAAEGPSAPPLNSSSSLECGDSNKVLSSSRLSSFRRILSRERSSRRVNQSSFGQDQDFVEDLERQ